MSNLHIVYGFCENQHKATLFEYLVQHTSILKVKTIGHIADQAVFAALTESFIYPNVCGIHWVQACVPNKKKNVNGHALQRAGLSRRKLHQFELSDAIIKQLKKSSRAYRKQRNRTLTEKNWRQHINRKAALNEVNSLLTPTPQNAFFVARHQSPAPYSTCY